jgi:DNA-binding transcriptional regulator YhcF (GntR family)
MSDISVNEASTNVLLAELESRGIISIARKLDTYLPTEKEKVIATGVAYNMNNPRQVLAEVLSYQYAYERIALETLDIYKNDEEQYEEWFKGEGTI